MAVHKLKIPGKLVSVNKRKKSITVKESAYEKLLPEGLDIETCNNVHSYDDAFYAASIRHGSKVADTMKKGKATLTATIPDGGMLSAKFDKDNDPVILIRTEYDSDSEVGQVLMLLGNAAAGDN